MTTTKPEQRKPDLIGQVLGGTYQIIGLLGQGGMGMVFEAQHTRLPKQFAVKVLDTTCSDPSALQRFEREALVTTKIGHPHIVEVLDFNHLADGRPYIIMECLVGRDLRVHLSRTGPMAIGDVGSILMQACSALTAAHDVGVIHRDLKPSNLFLCRRGQRDDYVKLLDFGISKMIGATTRVTKTHSSIGTPAYMSPEQARGSARTVDHRADIYSLGAILYEMLTGAPPFGGESIPEIMFRIVYETPTPPSKLRPGLAPAVETLLLKALAKAPDDRFGTARELAEAFSAAAGLRGLHYVPTEDRRRDWEPTNEPAAPATTPNVASESSFDTTLPAEPLSDTAPTVPAKALGAREPTNPTHTGQLLPRSRSRFALVLALAGCGIAAAVILIFAIPSERTSTVGKLGARDVSQTPAHVPPREPLDVGVADTGAADVSAATPSDTAGGNETRTERQLSVTIAPPGASGALVFVGDKRIGRAPLQQVSVGTEALEIVVKRSGYRPWRQRIAAGTGDLQLQATLHRQRPGRIHITTKAEGKGIWAEVLVDGRPVGKTPLVLRLTAGRHQVELRRGGYRTIKQPLVIRAGRSQSKVFNLHTTP